MIPELTLIALSLSMAGQRSADLPAGEALLSQDAQVSAVNADAQEEAKDKKGQKREKVKRVAGKRQEAGAKKRTEAQRAADKKALQKRFDTDGDGKLNEAESKALKDHVQGLRKKASEKKSQRKDTREAMKKQFDANGDGKLDETERKALKAHVEARRKEAAKKGAEEGGKQKGEGVRSLEGRRKRVKRAKGEQKKKDLPKKKGGRV